MIDVQNLSKTFGTVRALIDVSFRVLPGEIFGFLGANGAGKTTAVKVLSTLLKPSSGRVYLNGFDVVRQQTRVRKSLGIIFQEPSLDDRLTAIENLKFHAMLYRIPRATFKARARFLLKMVGLAQEGTRNVQTFSMGMRRRLEIARGLLHQPPVLFLDEPTVYLDPQTRHMIWNYLLRLNAELGVTMFLTTHYLAEAEHCNRIAIIDEGRIISTDTPKTLKTQLGGDTVQVETSNKQLAISTLEKLDGVRIKFVDDRAITVSTPSADTDLLVIVDALRASGATVHRVHVEHTTLEDVFMKVTGHTIRETNAHPMDRVLVQHRAAQHPSR
jgi:ABC-2 type transport system ATP-binding protein